MTENEIMENHKNYLDRIELYRKYGYDIDKERSFVIEKALPVSGKILEAGTGKGHFALALAREGFNFTSFDVSVAEQQYAWRNLAYHGLASHVRFDVADAECIPYKDASFDVVFAINIVHHLTSIRKVCDEFIRILSPSGKMVLSDFNTQGFAIIDKIHALEGRQHELGAGIMIEVKTILTDCGFKVDEHQGANQDVLVACRLLNSTGIY